MGTSSPQYQVTRLNESAREAGLELIEGTASEFKSGRERVKLIALPFSFSSQLQIWSFHVLVVQGPKKCI